MRRVGAALLLLFTLVAPGYAMAGEDVTTADIATADAERKEAAARLADATAEYEANAVAAETLQGELQQLGVELTVRERELALAKVAAERAVRQQYVSAGSAGVVALFDAASVNDLAIKRGYLEQMSTSDAATLNRLAAVKESFEDQQLRLETAVTK